MKVVALLMPRALGQVSPSADVGQQTYAAESAALKELYSQSHRGRRCRGALDADQHQHGRPVRRTRVLHP